MQKIVCLLRLNDEEKAQYREAAEDNEIIFTKDSNYNNIMPVDEALVADADVIMGWIPASLLPAAKNLKWMQAQSSGVDHYMVPGLLREGAMLSSATGAYGLSVAEHMFAMMLGLMKNLHTYRDQQHAHIWKDAGAVKTPKGMNILILGTGDLGSTFAGYCKAFGAHTIGVRHDPSKPAPGIDEMHGMDELDALVTKADVVCCMLPHVESMVHYFNYERFHTMKPDAIFLNGGRGTICDNNDLDRVLSEGHLWGAALDNPEREPMPDDDVIWDQEKVVVSPHVAGGDHLDDTLRKIAAIGLENLKHYLKGEPIRNRKV